MANPAADSVPLRLTVTPQRPPGTEPFADAISGIESGGRYDILGPVTRSGDRAYGKYQVMGQNIPEWTREVFGRPMTPQEFLSNPQAQDAVFQAKFGQYVQKYGPEGAARAWFAGEGGMNDLGRKDQLGTSVASYASRFNQALGYAPQGGGSATAARAPANGDRWWDEDPDADGGGARPAAASDRWWDEDPDADAASVPTDMGGYAPSQVPQVPGEIGPGTAFARGLAQGATANFIDELKGVQAAGGGATMPMNLLLGLARLGYEALAGRGQGTEAYEAARNAVRGDMEQAQAAFPGTTLAGNVAGVVAVPVGGLLKAGGTLARVGRSAAVGAGYGGLAGAGEAETAAEAVPQAASGAAIGGIAGAAAVPALAAVEGLARGAGALARPVATAVRGAINPEREAARRVTTAITRDMQGSGSRLTPAEFAAARAEGAPVAVADLGGETTRALARSAANTSTEGREALQRLAEARFEGQANRAVQFIRRLVGDTDTAATRDSLLAAARAANRPAYARAFNHPNAASMWDEGFAQLMNAPVVQDAARAATRTGANRAAIEGFPPVKNPFRFDGDQAALAGEARPSLQFWDAVKRNLDDRIGALQRAGENSAARDAIQLRNALVSHLDELVPPYREARAGAARFFGAEDALEAGANFVRSSMTAAEGARALARMSPAERELFKQGFASRLIDTINNTRDRVNVLNQIGATPEARNKIKVAIGEAGYRRIEAFLTVEQVMDRLRTAVQGNSSTVRQLVEMGLAGGAGGAITGDFSPQTMLTSALVYGLGRRGAAKIDERVARRVAEMLASSDPNVLARGIQTVTRSRQLLKSFRALDERLARIGGSQSSGAPLLQAPGVGRAEDE